jgi:hypothetical protein
MKYEFKQMLLQDHISAFKELLVKGLEKPSYLTGIVLIFLNIARDSNFDELPSFTYRKREELKEQKADITYYQLKELK